MDYRWTTEPRGQFVDGHEREDVVTYRQEVFLPAWEKLELTLRHWGDMDHDGLLHGPIVCPTVMWHHDESTFYANDRRNIRWVHKGEGAIPYAKGKGVSLMVADFVSADYGWLRAPDGSQQARVLFKVGKAWEGYFTNEDILRQAMKVMDILKGIIRQKIMFLFLITQRLTSSGRTMHCPPARCLKTPPGMGVTGEWQSQSSMAMGSLSLT